MAKPIAWYFLTGADAAAINLLPQARKIVAGERTPFVIDNVTADNHASGTAFIGRTPLVKDDVSPGGDSGQWQPQEVRRHMDGPRP